MTHSLPAIKIPYTPLIYLPIASNRCRVEARAGQVVMRCRVTLRYLWDSTSVENNMSIDIRDHASAEESASRSPH